MHALLTLGKTCTMDELGMTLRRTQSTGVNLSQLDRASAPLTRRVYLDGGRSGKYIFLYHACSSTSHVHVFAMFMPNGAVKLHLVDHAPRRQQISRLQESYHTRLTAGSTAHGSDIRL
jgi:DNA polymerase epsilon subunit 1